MGRHVALLRVHRILVGSAIALALVMLAWGARALGRHEEGGALMVALGAVTLVAGSIYLRRNLRKPPF
jgi:hypothetical protein